MKRVLVTNLDTYHSIVIATCADCTDEELKRIATYYFEADGDIEVVPLEDEPEADELVKG